MLGALLDATAFLTRVPVPERRAFDLARAVWAFPVIGAAVGVLVGGVAVGSGLVLPALAAAVLAVTAEVVLTGALHLEKGDREVLIEYGVDGSKYTNPKRRAAFEERRRARTEYDPHNTDLEVFDPHSE